MRVKDPNVALTLSVGENDVCGGEEEVANQIIAVKSLPITRGTQRTKSIENANSMNLRAKQSNR